MPFFSKVFRSRDREGAISKSKKHSAENGAVPIPSTKPHWEDAWERKHVEPEEVQELLRGCTQELKSRALEMPFLLLPFRPASDPSAARSFIRNYFNAERGLQLHGQRLSQELLLTEPMVLCSVVKWCWSRLAGGVVTWEAYELFRVGEQDSDMARDAFATFIPISVESDARTKIIFDFFDLISAIAAHGKTNGMGGRKLSRLAGWWAFEQVDQGNGFDGGYKSWSSAADAASHLFFAYLRSLSPDSVQGTNGISALPLSLQTLVQATEYPPEQLNMSATSKVVMIVDSVSPTPFALLRRAKHFEYRDEDRALQEFASYEDPVEALTEECRRVLNSISSTNQSIVSTSKASTSLRDASWSRFEDIGFGGFGEYSDHEDEVEDSALGKKSKPPPGLRSAPQSKNHDLGRPTTPSWADFLSSGFVDEAKNGGPAPLHLPHDKILPPINSRRGYSSQSHRRTEEVLNLGPGELASINSIYYDDAFWWVWISSLAGEETTERKAVFGRCALIETTMRGGKWLIIEEIVKGAAPEPDQGAYIAEKKTRFGFSKRGKLVRTKSMTRKTEPPVTQPYTQHQASPMSKTSIGPDQHARIQAAAAALQQKQKQHERDATSPRRARMDDGVSTKTNSVFTLQPVIVSEAASAMKWANTYDKNAIRAAYLGNNFAGKGSTTDLPAPGISEHDASNGFNYKNSNNLEHRRSGLPRDFSGLSKHSAKDRDLPALPSDTKQNAIPTGERKRVPSAPLPVTPPHNLHGSNEAATDAAQVPLPAVTSTENLHPSERTPFPHVAQTSDGPLQNGAETLTQEVDNVGSSPDSKKGPKKLVKTQGAGFKGFFGRKKPEGPTRLAPPQPADSTAVAAARAAYVGPQMKPNYNGSQTNLGRRLSMIGRKRLPAASNMPTTAGQVQDPEVQDVFASNQFGNHDVGGSQRDLSRINAYEERQANHEFRKFDQGPMMDQPAFVPEDSPEQRASEPPTPVEPARERMEPPAPVEAVRHPEPSIQVEPAHEKHTETPTVVEPVPERRQIQEQEVDLHRKPGEVIFQPEPQRIEPNLSESEDERSESPALDRWAQIRKNAAERAARHNEDSSKRNQVTKSDEGEVEGETSGQIRKNAAERAARHNEDSLKRNQVTKPDEGEVEGETSGEETIESRVARIKARVAELTGTMDGGANRVRTKL